jgi:heterodisulfide reductase subunit A
MIMLTIDGKQVQGEKGKTILETAREHNIEIPTLCHHPALTPAGACRLCIVEITENGRKRIVTSCNYPVKENMEVVTRSPEIIETRKWILELLLSRCPDADIIKGLSKQYGISRPRFIIEAETCILCGLCIRICEERMGKSVITCIGRGVERKIATPWKFVQEIAAKGDENPAMQIDFCMTCGACVAVCPTGAIRFEDITPKKPIPILSEFDHGLKKRPPIYIPYPQGVPNAPVIDRETCIHFLNDACGICAETCPSKAIDFSQEDEVIEIDVGAVILSPGFEEFDPAPLYQYGYKKYPNVVSSIEFERILSASGPFEGKLVQPGNRHPVSRIAWIQCIGSRDSSCRRDYCSSVCCTYAVKQAIIAREHAAHEIDETIFYMDMRTYGKDFDKFYQRAEKLGVRFVKGRVFNVESLNGSDTLSLRYVDENGNHMTDCFDMVVLSVGLSPPDDIVALSKKTGIHVDRDGFSVPDMFSSIVTSRPGIFAAGVFAGPKDIPETVIQASGAAGEVAVLLSPSRRTLTRKKEYPPERDVSSEEPRIGVFVCHCGINIGGVIDVPAVTSYGRTLGNVEYAEHNLYTCSQDSQERIKTIIGEHRLNRVVVASCSPRTHEPLFQETLREAGLNKYLLEMANIRDQCSWIHMHDPEKATEKAKDLVGLAVTHVRLKKPLKPLSLPVHQSALVIGGGIAGITAALTLADQGFQVYLVERNPELGGMSRHLYFNLDQHNIQSFLSNMITRAREHPFITTYTDTSIVDAYGYVGNFTTEIMRYHGKEIEKIEHGVTIIATGAVENKPEEYLYGKDPRVMTQRDLEEKIQKGDDSITSCNNLVMILCVGSRDNIHPYCSKVCCNQAIKNALKLKELHPQMIISILYRDIRTYGKYERFYQEARNRGILFIRYNEEKKPDVSEMHNNGKSSLKLDIDDTILGETISITPDILVLGTGMIPSRDIEEIAQFYKVPLNEDRFFLEAHVKLRPVEFSTDGVFLCGCAHSPKSLRETMTQAKAAAARATAILTQESIAAEGIVAAIDEELCSGCGCCENTCSYGAITFDREKKRSNVNEVLCKGCGCCVAACPSGAAQLRGSTDKQIIAMIDSLFEKK